MGLDNGFVGRFKKAPDVELKLAYFRKYYTLNDWILRKCERVNPEEPYEVIVTKENLEELLNEVESLAKILQKLTYSQIAYYEDNGYPQYLIETFYGFDFSPTSSSTFAAGHKLIKLYGNILCMLELIEENDPDDFYITFYSSF